MIVIGELINGTRKRVRKAVTDHHAGTLVDLVKKQDEAGADYIDLNAGTGSGSLDQEAGDMEWLIDIALENTEKPLCIDSADPRVIRRAVDRLGGRRPWMLNSIKGDTDSLGESLSWLAEHEAPFVALAMDEEGIAKDVEGRLKVCGRIFEEASRRSIDPARIFFDPLVIPVVTDVAQGMVTATCVREIKERFPGSRTVLGLSNISHGLPKRAVVNRGFLTLAVANGLDAALVDPTDRPLLAAWYAAELLSGRDARCRRYTRAFRKGVLD